MMNKLCQKRVQTNARWRALWTRKTGEPMNDDATRSMGPPQGPDATKTSALPSPSREEKRWLPSSIGRYRVIRLLGEGGMGAVYEAEQENPRRTVALKVIKPGLASPGMLLRFERESQALGRLQHPGVAQIYEAGMAETPFGQQPFFAMELIRGDSLRHYVAANHLGPRQRLELMAKICDAVHHAHQRGLIHRDLKPGNVIVDESGQPKILDFGLARLTDKDPLATQQTDMGQLVGTLSYMSPEQVLADPLELDTRTDVYSLGVILYELLTGERPYQLNASIADALQTIRQHDPAPLGTINRAFRGDVETIVAKALEKDKARRYNSAADFAADIRRFLHDEPIEARPASVLYQVRKFTLRHKALVAGVAAVFVVLAAGIVVSASQASRAGRAERAAIHERDLATAAGQAATRERDRALDAEQKATEARNRAVSAEDQAIQERNRAVTEKQRADTEAASAKAVSEFLRTDLLAQASASSQATANTKPDPDLKVRTALDRAAAKVAGKFDKQPLVEASIRQTIGSTYKDLGLFPEAQGQLELSVNLLTRGLGQEHPDTLAAMIELASLYSRQDKYEQAEALMVKILAAQQRIRGEQHEKTAEAMNQLAVVITRRGRFADAEPLLVKALAVRRRTLGDENVFTLSTMSNLATIYYSQGKFSQALPLFAGILATDRRVLGEEHPETLTVMNNLAAVHQRLGEYAQAEALVGDALRISRRVLGPEHPDTFRRMNNLAVVYMEQRKYPQAEELYAAVLAGWRRLLGEEHSDTLTATENLGVSHLKQRNYALAKPLLTRTLELRRRVLGPENAATLRATNHVAALQLEQAEYVEAETLLRSLLSLYEKIGSNSWLRFNTQSQLGASLTGQSKFAEAEPFLVAGYNGMVERQASIPAASRPDLESSGIRLIQLYQNWGKPEKAAEWSRKLEGSRVAAGQKP